VWFLYYEAVSKVSDFMNEPTVVFDDVNPYTGMRGMLVRRGGEAVDVVPLLGVVPDAARRSLGVEAVALGSWHYLKMDWVTRELIGFEVGDSRLEGLGFSFKVRVIPKGNADAGKAIPAAAWTIEAGKRMEDAMLAAVTLYAEQVGYRPQVILVRHLPEAAGREFVITPSGFATSPMLEEHQDGGGYRFPIVEAGWVWNKMVLVL